MTNNDYIFPFSTCEKPNTTRLAQPYSVVINGISILIILYFLFQMKNVFTFFLILSLLIFECLHTFSHAIHLPSYIQLNIIHFFAYIVNFLYLLTFYHYTKKAPSTWFILLLGVIVTFDIYAFLFLSFVYYFSSSLLIFFSIMIYYYKYIPKNKQNYILTILVLGIFIMLLFFNSFNTKIM